MKMKLIFVFQIPVYKYLSTSKQWLGFPTPEEQTKATERGGTASPAPALTWMTFPLNVKKSEWSMYVICPNIPKNGHFKPSSGYVCSHQCNELGFSYISHTGDPRVYPGPVGWKKPRSGRNLAWIDHAQFRSLCALHFVSWNTFLLNKDANWCFWELIFVWGMSKFIHTQVYSF